MVKIIDFARDIFKLHMKNNLWRAAFPIKFISAQQRAGGWALKAGDAHAPAVRAVILSQIWACVNREPDN